MVYPLNGQRISAFHQTRKEKNIFRYNLKNNLLVTAHCKVHNTCNCWLKYNVLSWMTCILATYCCKEAGQKQATDKRIQIQMADKK